MPGLYRHLTRWRGNHPAGHEADRLLGFQIPVILAAGSAGGKRVRRAVLDGDQIPVAGAVCRTVGDKSGYAINRFC